MSRRYKIGFSGFSGMDYRREELNDVYLLYKIVQSLLSKNNHEVCYLFNPLGDGINLDKYFYLLKHNIPRYSLHDINKSLPNAFEFYEKNEPDIINQIIDSHSAFNQKILGKSDIHKIKLRIFKLINRTEWLIKKEGLNLFVVFGDSLESSVIRMVSRKNDIRCISLENGYFRPFTLMVDEKGVNADASIPRDKNFYLSLQFDNLDALYSERRIVPEVDLTTIKEVAEYRKWYYKNLGIELTDQANNKFNFVDSFTPISEDEFYKETNYIFVPLQLETDMQIIKNAPKIESLYDFLIKVMSLMEDLNSELVKNNKKPYKLVIKKHPLYTSERHLESYGKIDQLLRENDSLIESVHSTEDLIKHSDFVVTINSTVGFEAIEKFKKVITFGDAFYNIQDLTHPYFENGNAEISSVVKYLNRATSQEFVKKVICYLRYNYFVVINRKAPSTLEIENLVQKILGEKNEE